MPNSRRGADKRARLVAAAAELLHQQGVQRTTLADIAAAADVPLGNVYYYFKTRDDIVHAVIDHREAQIQQALEVMSQRRTPKARLKALAELWSTSADEMAECGCPEGGLAYELNKNHDELAEHSRVLLGSIVDWTEAQFREMGLREPRGLAAHYIGSIQGAVLLANTLRDAPLLKAEVRRLERWIETLD